MTTTQRWLPLKVELRFPVCTLAAARDIMGGLHENLIKELIDDGTLMAWDISRAGRSARSARSDAPRSEYRLLTLACRNWPQPTTLDLDALVLRFYGRPRPFLPGTWWHRTWNCDAGHMLNLVADGTLAIVPRSAYGRGRGNTPSITWDSAVHFLETRRL